MAKIVMVQVINKTPAVFTNRAPKQVLTTVIRITIRGKTDILKCQILSNSNQWTTASWNLLMGQIQITVCKDTHRKELIHRNWLRCIKVMLRRLSQTNLVYFIILRRIKMDRLRYKPVGIILDPSIDTVLSRSRKMPTRIVILRNKGWLIRGKIATLFQEWCNSMSKGRQREILSPMLADLCKNRDILTLKLKKNWLILNRKSRRSFKNQKWEHLNFHIENLFQNFQIPWGVQGTLGQTKTL